jgi:hypothetical protein
MARFALHIATVPALLVLLSSLCNAETIRVPDGFVLQPLEETDGQIARPKDWFFTRSRHSQRMAMDHL